MTVSIYIHKLHGAGALCVGLMVVGFALGISWRAFRWGAGW